MTAAASAAANSLGLFLELGKVDAISLSASL